MRTVAISSTLTTDYSSPRNVIIFSVKCEFMILMYFMNNCDDNVCALYVTTNQKFTEITIPRAGFKSTVDE